MSEEIKEMRGTITKVHFASPTFSAGRLLPAADDVTRRAEISFAGACFVKVGESVCLRGQWINHKKYGRQWAVESRVYEEAATTQGLSAWLAHHGRGMGIGPVRADKIAKAFGENFLGVLRDNPEQVAIEARIPLEKVKQLADAWTAHSEEARLGTKLAAWGLTAAQIKTLYAALGGSTVAILEADPYAILGVVDGLGFKRVDEIALKMGTPPTHPGRLQAAVVYALKQARDGDGSTCMERRDVVDATVELLGTAGADVPGLVEESIGELLAGGDKLRVLAVGSAEGEKEAVKA